MNQFTRCNNCYSTHLPEAHDNVTPDKCEVCKSREVWHHNETVRNRNTKIAKIISICRPCFTKITGAK